MYLAFTLSLKGPGAPISFVSTALIFYMRYWGELAAPEILENWVPGKFRPFTAVGNRCLAYARCLLWRGLQCNKTEYFAGIWFRSSCFLCRRLGCTMKQHSCFNLQRVKPFSKQYSGFNPSLVHPPNPEMPFLFEPVLFQPAFHWPFPFELVSSQPIPVSHV